MNIPDVQSGSCGGMVLMDTGRSTPEGPGCGAVATSPPGASVTSLLGGVPRTFEPLKVCLDDDSSLEDGEDEDGDYCMFDDDAFAFGDEDFVVLTEALGRHNPAPARPPNQPAPSAFPAPPAPVAAFASQPSLLQFQASASGGADSSLPSTAASSAASLGTLMLSSHASRDSLSSKKTRSGRRVSLRVDVAVVPIPAREEYSHLVRERMWSSAEELSYNTMRNATEYAVEGFDWRNAAEDDQMVRSPSGERIQPVHYMNLTGRYQAPSTKGIGMNTMDARPLPS